MSALLEIERAVCRGLTTGDDAEAAGYIVADGLTPAERLDVHRDTFVGTLTNALRLSYPAVERLVGADFFEGATRVFIETAPPQSAYLNDYGAGFTGFLAGFPPAAPLPYLPAVARLEWAVNRAVHADDPEPLDLGRLTAIAPEEHDRIVFEAHPSVDLVETDFPADEIWDAVLAEDDRAMAAIDLESGPTYLLVHRPDTDVEVLRLDRPAWRFLAALRDGRTLAEAIESTPGADAAAELAAHLTAGRFVGAHLADQHNTQ